MSEPLRIKIPQSLFQSHEFTLAGIALNPQQIHEVVAFNLEGNLTLPSAKSIKSVVVKRDDKGDLYLEITE